jgi:hypothetical protein
VDARCEEAQRGTTHDILAGATGDEIACNQRASGLQDSADREEEVVVGEAELVAFGEEFVELARLEAGEPDPVPEGSGDVAAHLEGATRGTAGVVFGNEGHPAFGGGEEDREAIARCNIPESNRAIE